MAGDSSATEALLKTIEEARQLAERMDYSDRSRIKAVGQALHGLEEALVKGASADLNAKDEDFHKRVVEVIAPQEIQFLVDCLPHIKEEMFKTFKPWSELSFLDVGPRFCFGADLLARLHKGISLGFKINVEAIDISELWANFAYLFCPEIPLTINDVGNITDRVWDVVYCSGVIEHVPDTDAFMDKLLQVTGKLLFVMAPYKEDPILVPSHQQTITEKNFKKYKPVKMITLKSNVWRPHDRENYKMILAVFKK